MKEGDSLSLSPDSGSFVDQPDTGKSTFFERGVEISHGKTDVVDAGPPLREKLPDRRGRVTRLEQFNEGLARSEAGYRRPVGIAQREIG